MKKGSKMTEEQRKRISKSHKGIIAGMSRKKHSEESKRKMSEAHKRILMNPELRKKISEATKKAMANPVIRKKLREASRGHTPWNKGIPHTEEHKRKLREARRKLLSNPEYRKKMSEAHKGQIPWNKSIPPTKEQIEKQKATYQKTLLSHPEIRGKMSLAKKGKPSWNKGISMSEEARKKLSEARKGKRLSQKTEFKLGHIPWHKGKKGVYTPEQLKRMSAARKGTPAWNKDISPTREQIEKQRASIIKITSNPEYRKKMSEVFKKAWANPELRKKQSEVIKKFFSNPEVRKRWGEYSKGRISSEETRKKLSIISKRNWSNPDYRKKIIDFLSTPEIREKSRKRILKLFESGSFPGVQNTKPERQIKEELIRRGFKEGIDFIHQFKFMNKFMCDFCFPNQKVIIEVDGDFWHANPNKYPEGSRLHKHQLEGRNRDKSKNAYISKVDDGSWKLIRFWESDIKRDVVTCVNKIEEILAKKR